MKPDLDGGFTQLLSVTLGKIGSGFGDTSIAWDIYKKNSMVIVGEEATKCMACSK